MVEQEAYQEVELEVQGMTWMGWEPKVARALEELPGIKKAYAIFPEKKAVITYDPASVAIEEMCQILFKSGYVAGPKTNERTTSAVISYESRDKSNQKDDLICYCFEYTKDDIEQDFVNNGQSLIMEKIAAEKKAGGCDCGNKNPKGKWCLSDVHQVVEGVKKTH